MSVSLCASVSSAVSVSTLSAAVPAQEEFASTALQPWMQALIREVPQLVPCLQENRFPTSFLKNIFGASDAFLAEFPRYLTIFIGVYFLCGVITLILRFARGQKSLNSIYRQIANVLLTSLCTLLIPATVLLAKAIVYVIRYEVAPYQGPSDLFRYLGTCFGEIFYILWAFLAVFFAIWMPLSSAVRYLKIHHLGGVPHMIFDLGFGPFILAVLLLAAHYGRRELYLLILLAAILLCIIQRGGYISEVYNSQAVHNEAAYQYRVRTGKINPSDPDSDPTPSPAETSKTTSQP